MIDYTRSPPRRRPFVYALPGTNPDEVSALDTSLFASTSKFASPPSSQRYPRRPRGPSSASTLSTTSSSSSASSSSSRYPPYSYTYPAQRYSPVPASDAEEEEEDDDSELDLEPSPAVIDEEDEATHGAGWHYTYTSTAPAAVPPRSPTSPKRELSDAHERRLSAELRRSPPPSHHALLPAPSSYSPPRRSRLASALDDNHEEMKTSRRQRAPSSSSLRRRDRREGWGEFNDAHEHALGASPPSSSVSTTTSSPIAAHDAAQPSALHLLIHPHPRTSYFHHDDDQEIDTEVREKDSEGAFKDEGRGDAVGDDDDDTASSPTCTDALAREWQALILRWRFGVFRAKRRVRGAFASRR